MNKNDYNEFDIAIIGMACRFPGADSPMEFWQNLIEGKESIKRLSDKELLEAGIDPSFLENPLYVKASPLLNNPGFFDASFFGFTPAEALALDPQHRILLTCAYEALENAGYDPDKYNGRIGVYTGSAMNTYFLNTGLKEKFVDDYIPTLIGNDKDFLSTRLSYKLNLKGPSINIQTACSTSLVAVHLACQSILNEENDMAIAGAVSVKAPHNAGYIYDRGGIVSPDGHVRAFDAKANGTVFGSGAGILVLKKLTNALNDRDNILAVIKASAVNNDGSEKAGYTAPGIRSQADVVIDAIVNSGIDAEEISYIETHGSGTPVGDPIEVAALTKAFRKFTDKKNYCAIGSVKTNIGHLDAAAGIAGIIKTILCLINRRIPASLNYDEPNPEIDFADSPFYVNTKLREWESSQRIAGVMSTGMGGTNAYVILQEAPEIKESKSLFPGLIVLSAKNETVLNKQSGLLSDYLQNQKGEELKNTAYTLQIGRKEFECRRFLIAKNNQEATELLIQNNSKRIFSGRVHNNIKRPVIFLFPGVGDHYIGMGYELYNNIKFFKEIVDYCADILKKYININITDVIYPEHFQRSSDNTGIDLKKMLSVSNSEDPYTNKLNQTIYSQPALFIIEYALAKLWMHLGVIPEALIGHSMGEYVAACLAGVFSLEDALKIIAIRAQLVNNLPKASMVAVTLPENELVPLLSDNLSVSLINSPNLCVVAGPENEMDKFKDTLKSKGILYRPVQNTHAFHSKMMAPVVEELVNEIRKVKLSSPKIPYTSNVTGEWISQNEAINPQYWGRHLMKTARFSSSVEKAWQIDNSVLLEVGPGNTLSVLAMQHPSRNSRNNPVTISSIKPVYDNQSDINYLLTSIGKLWLSGIKINWEKLYEEDNPPRRIPLPTYPFQYENYWLKNKIDSIKNIDNGSKAKINDFKDWFYTPVWIRKNFSKRRALTFEGKKLWVIFNDESGLGVQIKNYLENNNQTVISVKSGLSYYENNNDYVIDIRNPSNYINLFKELKSIIADEINIIHPGCYSEKDNTWFDYRNDDIQYQGFYSLIFIIQSLSRLKFSVPINIEIISNHIHLVTGNEVLCPKKALVLGLCGVIPKEFPGIKCFNIDLMSDEINDNNSKEITENLITEFDKAVSGELLAYRGKFRWLKKYDNINLLSEDKNSGSQKAKILKEKGVYLITGGTGGIGLTIAKYLAENFRARLILTQISEMPPKIKWREIIKGNHIDNSLSQKIRKLIEIEESGGIVNVFSSPASDKIKMKEIINNAVNEYGEINGIIHCAGIVSPGIISAKEKETIEKVFLPKVEGTLVLNELIRDLNLDFFVICSSITSVITPFAESDYSAANAFLDAFAQYSNSFNKIHTLSINWPGWKDVGQLAKLEMLKGTEEWKKTALEKAISPQEGLEAFKLALNSDFDQIIVSPEPLENSDIMHSVSAAENTGINQNKIEEKISKKTNHTSVEENLSLIWKEILGVMKSDNDDNFFEAGGHSLLAIQLISSIRKTFQVDLSIEDILDAATFSAICKKIYDLRSMKNIMK